MVKNKIFVKKLGATATSLLFICILSTHVAYGTEEEDLDVAIIGGGFAGLRAAVKVKNQTKNYKIFEARYRLGGRAWTEHIDKEDVDCGGEFIDDDHKEMLQMLKKYKIKKKGAPLENQVIFLKEGKKKTISDFNSTIKSLHEKLNQKSSTLNNDDYFIHQNDHGCHTNLLESLELENEEHLLLNAVIRDEAGIDIKEAPLSSILSWKETLEEYKTISWLKSNKLTNFLLKAYHAQYRISGGTKSLVEAMAKDIGQEHISLNMPLTNVSWQSESQRFKMVFQGDKTVFARTVIMTIPFSVLAHNKILDDESLEITPKMREYIDSMTYGTNSKIVVPVETPVHLTYGIDLDNGSIAWSTCSQKINIMLGGTPGEKATEESGELYANPFLKALEKNMKKNQQLTIINWSKDPYSKGSYRVVKSDAPYSDFDNQSELNTDLNKFSTSLFQQKVPFIFAGEHLAYNDGGYMNSAVKTGHVAGKLICKYLRKKK